MRLNLFWFFTILVILSGCGQEEPRAELTPRGVRVARFSSNQPSMQVVESRISNPDLQVFEEQGYQEASDRLFQMDVLRRLSQARLSALVGAKAFDKDTAAVAIGLPWSVASSTERIRREHPAVYEELEAFARGVNTFIAEMPYRKPEVQRLYISVTEDPDYRPEPWVPMDSIAITKNVSFYLSSAITEKIVMGTIMAEVLGPELAAHQMDTSEEGLNPVEKMGLIAKASKLAGLFDFRPLENTLILQDDGSQFRPNRNTPIKSAKPPVFELPEFPLSFLGQPHQGGICINPGYPFPECSRKSGFGSNNFVVNADFTGTGQVILGNDTHLPLSFPSTLYEVALDSVKQGGTIQSRGLNMPGVPGVLIGMNGKIAWGLTNLGADVDDIYLEIFSKSEPTKRKVKNDYLADTKLVKFEVQVRKPFGESEVRELKMRWSPHGPVFSDLFPLLQDRLKMANTETDTMALSYRWVGHQPTLEYVAVSGVNRSQNFEEFKGALGKFEAGAQNFVFADVEGNIGYYAHGNFPVRKYLNGFYPTPYVPALGNGDHEWMGFRAKVPEMYNPPSGRIVTANNDPYGHSLNKSLYNFEDYFGVNFSSGCRAKRLTELLEAHKGRLDLAAARKIQTDHKDLVAIRYLTLVRSVMEELKDLTPEARDVADKMLAWEASGAFAKRQFSEPVKFRFFLEALIEEHFAELGLSSLSIPLMNDDATSHEGPKTLLDVLKENTVTLKTVYNHLNDGLKDGRREKAMLRIKNALEKTPTKLAFAQRQKKSWGQWNRLSFTNALEGILPPILNYPLERDGSFDTVDVSGEVGGRSLGPNFRMLVVLERGKGITAYNVMPGGNWSTFDGQPLRDELLLWRDGKQRAMVPFLN